MEKKLKRNIITKQQKEALKEFYYNKTECDRIAILNPYTMQAVLIMQARPNGWEFKPKISSGIKYNPNKKRFEWSKKKLHFKKSRYGNYKYYCSGMEIIDYKNSCPPQNTEDGYIINSFYF